MSAEFNKWHAYCGADTTELRRMLKRTDQIPAQEMEKHLEQLRVQHAMIGRDLDRLQKALVAKAVPA